MPYEIASNLVEAEAFVDRFLTEAFEEKKHGDALALILVDMARGLGTTANNGLRLRCLMQDRAEAYREDDARSRSEAHGRCDCIACVEAKAGA